MSDLQQNSHEEGAAGQPADQVKPETDRREFLRSCGKFAAVTPPAVAFLLSTTMSSKAIAASSGRSGGKDGISALIFGAAAAPVGVAAVTRGTKEAAVAATPAPQSAVLPVAAPEELEIPPPPPPPPATPERG